jgi:curved DNA-binding protein CbpA
LQAAVDAMRAKIQASYKPHLDDYALLGIQPGVTKRDIKNAYRRQARRLHPDKGGDAEAFKAMYAAYRRLLAAI